MSDLEGFMFFIILLIIIVGIIFIKIFYDLWATSVTLNLTKNNSGRISISRILILVGAIIVIALVLGALRKQQQKVR